jgi:hypothetical protein
MRIRTSILRMIWLKVLMGGLAGALAYFALLCTHSAWEEVVAAALIGSISGIVDRSFPRVFLGAAACAVGWVAASLVFSIWIELGIGTWLGAGALLGGVLGACRRWSVAIPAMLFGFVAGALVEASRSLPVLFKGLRGVDIQLLVLVSAGLLLNLVAASFAPRSRVRSW